MKLLCSCDKDADPAIVINKSLYSTNYTVVDGAVFNDKMGDVSNKFLIVKKKNRILIYHL